jgi:iron complex outermembrane receptor protein
VTIKDAAGNDFQETQAVNVGESTAQGIEIEMQWAVTDNMRIDGNLGWLDHEYDDYRPGINPGDLGISGAGGQINPDLSSLEVPFSPELNYGLGVSYFQDLSSGATITYNVNMHYQDDAQTSSFPANFQGGTAANPVIKQKGNTQIEERTLVNGYITYTGTQGFEMSVYGKNLTDERYRVSANPVATLWNFSRFGPPREYGVQIGYSF